MNRCGVFLTRCQLKKSGEMMARGHNPAKPTALKLIHGTFRPDRAAANEVKPRPFMTDVPPPGLDMYARRAWRQYAPVLRKLGLLTEADGQAFITLCRAWSRLERGNVRLNRIYRKRRTELEEIRRAEVSVERSEHSLRLLWDSFGMTPSSRAKLDAYAPPAEVDRFAEEFLGPGA